MFTATNNNNLCMIKYMLDNTGLIWWQNKLESALNKS